MVQETTIKGQWWLPDEPNNRLSGEVTYGPTLGARLDLFDHFFDQDTYDKYTVWGKTVGGVSVTLFDCLTERISGRLPGEREAKIASYFGVIGGHFRDTEHLQFTKVTVDLSYLHQWTQKSGLKVAADEKRHLLQVTHEALGNFPLGSHGDLHLALEFSQQATSEYGECRLSERCVLTIKARTPASFDTFKEAIHQVQCFIALAVCRPVYPLSINACTDTPKHLIRSQPINEKFQIIQTITMADAGDANLFPHNMLFCLTDLNPNPAVFFKRFVDKYYRLKPMCDLYFSTLYNPEVFYRERFLILAHAAEAYHRATFDGKHLSDDEYRSGLQVTLTNAIPPDLDPAFKASLKEKFKYLHEFSLRKRLQEICTKFRVILQPYLVDTNKFSGEVAVTRNLLTHPDATANNQTSRINWADVWLMCERLRLLLEVCLLHELEFSEKDLRNLLSRSKRGGTIAQIREV